MSQPISSSPSWSGGAWLSLISLALGSFALVTSEFLPASLLTPIARDIGVSEGAAGQAVTATAICAGLAAPLLALLIGRIDRKIVLLALCALVVISNITVAVAMDYWVLLGARMILGIAMGGFFALAAAAVVHLVSIRGIGKGMSIVLLGISLATITAPPMGALVGEALGWRAAFLVGAGAGVVALIAQLLALPSVPATTVTNLSTLVGLLARHKVRVGLVASLLVVGGHFTAFTFIRPYLETAGGLDATALAGVLLAYGVANLVGNIVGGIAADRALGVGFVITCLLLGIAVLALANLGANYAPAVAFAALWGIAFGSVPPMIQAWFGRAAPDQLEGVGALFMSVLQFGIAIGAIVGGISVDLYGVLVPLYVAAVCGLLAAALIATQRSPVVSQALAE